MKTFCFRFDVNDGSTIVGHGFVWRVGIWSTVQTLDDFPHVWAVSIRHCVLEEIFPTFCFGLVDSFGGFTASINPLLLILMYCPTDAISSTDFRSHVRSHPRFRFLARFRFHCVIYCVSIVDEFRRNCRKSFSPLFQWIDRTSLQQLKISSKFVCRNQINHGTYREFRGRRNSLQ